MNRLVLLLEMSFLSTILALIKSFFGTIHTSYMILLILIALDTITGMSVALKYRRFNSKGLCKLIKKSTTYTVAIITIKLLELGIPTLVEGEILSQVLVAFLEITETVSILENLTLLGVPLPNNFVNLLLRYIRIPGLTYMIRMGRSDYKDVTEIDDIINHQIPTFEDKQVRSLLNIKLNFWKIMTMHVIHIFEDKDDPSEHLYYKLMSLMETELKDMNRDIKEAEISKEYIEKFEVKYRPQVDKWLQKIKHICFSDDSSEDKKDKLIDSIVIISYQTVTNTHRVFN